MGGDPLHSPGPVGVPTMVRLTDYGEESPAAIARELRLSTAGDRDAVTGVRRYGGVCAKKAKYGRAIHHNTNNSGTL